jgi:uncharacterized RDD family membrane protein YckC
MGNLGPIPPRGADELEAAVSEVVTGEAVVLDVPCARFPSRIAAVLIDMAAQLVLLVGVAIVVVVNSGHLDDATTAGIIVSCYVVIVVGYATIFETVSRGKTLGKMAFGLRVVSDDGSPVRFRQALIRALTGAIEIWSTVGAPIGLITSLLSEKGKRLGDMFAGTYVIQERTPHRPELPPVFAAVPPPLLGWAQVAEISRLSDQNAEAASSYLRRLHELNPAARDDLGLRLAAAIAAQVSPPPPPGTPPAAYLAAVLAIRREREFARLAAAQQGAARAAAAAEPGAAGAGGGAGEPWSATVQPGGAVAAPGTFVPPGVAPSAAAPVQPAPAQAAPGPAEAGPAAHVADADRAPAPGQVSPTGFAPPG